MSNQHRGAVRADQGKRPDESVAKTGAEGAHAEDAEAKAKAELERVAEEKRKLAEADAAAEAAAKAADDAKAAADLAAEAKAKAEEAATAAPIFRVKAGMGLTSKRGVVGGGEAVAARDFEGGQAVFDALIKRGHVVKS